MRFRAPFTLFKRRLDSGKIVWYYHVYDENGRRRQYSTGTAKKRDAWAVCIELYRKDRLIAQPSLTFADYTADWFIYDKCPYIKYRLLRGFSYSKSYAKNQRSDLERLMLPYFGIYKLDKISPALVETWLVRLHEQGYGNVSINHFLSTLKVIINEAYRRGDIDVNITPNIKPLAEHGKERGVLTVQEAQTLLAEKTWESVWSAQRMHYIYNLVAAQTGMRCGEIQALRKENVYPDHIDIKHSWDRIYGLKGTKTGKERAIPISSELYGKLTEQTGTKTEGPYLFSADSGKQPVDHKAIYKWFKRALVNIGISEKVRKERNISFHSWRHYVNSRLRAKGIPDSIIQAITGHSDLKMTEHYTHFTLEDMKDIPAALGG
jgi:integrase